MTARDLSVTRGSSRSTCTAVILGAMLIALSAPEWGAEARAGLKSFDPNRPEDWRADGSHFDPNAANPDKWHEWWYFNFHDPNAEAGGWDGLIAFYTRNDLDPNGSGAVVQVSVGIWNAGTVRSGAFLPLTGQGLSGYSSSSTKCDVRIRTGLADPNRVCTVTYDPNQDRYDLRVRDTTIDTTNALQIDLTYKRIAKGFLPDGKGFAESDWEELYWAVPMPYATVTGTIKLPLMLNAKQITATGYHDHNWGHWNDADAVWDWGECPVPASQATVVWGKVNGGDLGTMGIAVAVDGNDVIAWGENKSLNVTYQEWQAKDPNGLGPSNYPSKEHIYASGGSKIIELHSTLVHHLYFPGDTLGLIAEIIASYSGKVYYHTDPNNVLLTIDPNSSKGFLEYKKLGGEDDRMPPNAPTNVTATAVPNSCTAIDVSWSAPGGSPAGYNVFRSNQSGGPYLYRRGSDPNTTYRDFWCVDGTTYYYIVTAYDAVPNEGSKSGEASAVAHTSCQDICVWPRGDSFWDNRVHLPFNTHVVGLMTYNGNVLVSDVGPMPAYGIMQQTRYGTPSTGAGAFSTNLTPVGQQSVPYIPPYSDVLAGPYTFTVPPGNAFGEPYWMVLATAESSNDPFTTGCPWEDNNVAVLNYWEVTAQAGSPKVLHFWMENSTSEPALMELGIDRSSCPAGWGIETTPTAGTKQTMSPGQRLPASVAVVPTGSTTGNVRVGQTQYTLDGRFVRLSGGLTLAVTATRLGDTNGDNQIGFTDFLGFQSCMSGPWGADPFVPLSQGCQAVFDFDPDGDVDLADFRGFQCTFGT